MKLTHFASLIGVSQPMASKYKRDGKLVLDEAGDVLAVESVAALEGHLDEGRRQRALATLGEAGANSSPTPGVGLPLLPPGQAFPRATQPARSTKVEKDELDIAIRKLDLAERAGRLISAEEAALAARDAVTQMREAFGNTRREFADRICAQCGLPADKAVAVARILGEFAEEGLGRFAEAVGAIAAAEGASGARIEGQ